MELNAKEIMCVVLHAGLAIGITILVIATVAYLSGDGWNPWRQRR